MNLMESMNLKHSDKVMIVYGESGELFQGYITASTENYLTLHEYVTDVYRTLEINDIVEISKL